MLAAGLLARAVTPAHAEPLVTRSTTDPAAIAAGFPDLGPFAPAPEAISEAERALKLLKLPPGLRAEVWAAEPLLENPVAFAFDERGRAYVAETFRVHKAILDTRSRHQWPSAAYKEGLTPEQIRELPWELLDLELGARTVADRLRMLQKYFVGDLDRFTEDSEAIKRVSDEDGDGRADRATLYAAGWNGPLDGTLAGVLVRRGELFATNIPSLWRLHDRDDDGRADDRVELSTGYGVRYAFFGHDMHGLRIGPDGRLYFSIGDRGAHVRTKEGRTLDVSDTGAVFRCELDGSHLELFHAGLRNPQELAFDELGNPVTGDNNSDGGDQARIVYLVEGGDSGWRVGYQNLGAPRPRGPWNSERLWAPAFRDQAAYIVPPVANLTNGPSGLTYHPGAGPLSRYRGHFFLADFRGQASASGVWSFRLAPQGAGLRLVDPRRFAWGTLATDVEFAPDGNLYLLDWVTGWTTTGKGRIHRILPAGPAPRPASDAPGAAEILPRDLRAATDAELAALLDHPDVRVRQEAQFAIVATGRAALLHAALADPRRTAARRHALWGLGMILRGATLGEAAGAQAARAPATRASAIEALLRALQDRDPELRAQAARALGDAGAPRDLVQHAGAPLVRALRDPAARVRFFAALALGNLHPAGGATAGPHAAVLALLRDARDRDPYLRHAGSLALSRMLDAPHLAELARAPAATRAERLALTVALRRRHAAELGELLRDPDLAVAREAARAIADLPLPKALPALAALADAPSGAARRRLLADEAILLRVVEANLRLGDAAAARRLAAIAADPAAAPVGRELALDALAAWERPRPRNLVTGAYQPFQPPERDAVPARAVARDLLRALFASSSARLVPDGVLGAALRALPQLGEQGVDAEVAALAADPRRAPGVRRAALAALRALSSPRLDEALSAVARDPDLELRLHALELRVERAPEQATRIGRVALSSRAWQEQQVGVRILARQLARGPDAEALAALSDAATALASGKLPPELQLDVLDAIRDRPEPVFRDALARFEARRPGDEAGAYIEALRGGDARAGARIFERHEQVQCRRCHGTEGHGDTVGPGLAGIGRRYSRQYLLEAVVFPSKHFAPGFESVLVTMKGGAVHGGTIKRETRDALALDSVDEGLVSLQKKLIAERERGVSGMPEGFGYILSRRELRDLVAYLASLR